MTASTARGNFVVRHQAPEMEQGDRGWDLLDGARNEAEPGNAVNLKYQIQYVLGYVCQERLEVLEVVQLERRDFCSARARAGHGQIYNGRRKIRNLLTRTPPSRGHRGYRPTATYPPDGRSRLMPFVDWRTAKHRP